MKYLIIIIAFLFACNSPEESRFTQNTQIKDSLSDNRFIRQAQFDRAVIDDIQQKIDKSELIGTWVDSIVLYHENESWEGWKPIDKINRITLFKSSKYKWEEVNTYSKLDTIKYGQFWTSNIRDSSFLQLVYNSNGDTVFNQGDRGVANSFLIDYFNGDTLLIRAFNTMTHETKDEAHLMIRKN